LELTVFAKPEPKKTPQGESANLYVFCPHFVSHVSPSREKHQQATLGKSIKHLGPSGWHNAGPEAHIVGIDEGTSVSPLVHRCQVNLSNSFRSDFSECFSG